LNLRRTAAGKRPSIAAKPTAIKHMPAKDCALNVSRKNTTPSMIALMGTSKVTSMTLVAPALARIRK
jgi:hypothetical protein